MEGDEQELDLDLDGDIDDQILAVARKAEHVAADLVVFRMRDPVLDLARRRAPHGLGGGCGSGGRAYEHGRRHGQSRNSPCHDILLMFARWTWPKD